MFMKTITTNNRTLLFVEVPEDATDITLNELGRLDYLTQGGMDYTVLPWGTYRLIATTDTITEELARGVVERFSHATWRNYEFSPQYLENIMRSALDSFSSFLRKHSITGRHAIIEVL